MQAQVVVPVHRLDRPLRRAVESVLESEDFGVVIVAHGVAPEQLDYPQDPRVDILSVNEGIGHPGVAFNRGFEATSADWVGILGSDDWYEQGALEAMLQHALDDRADGVLAPYKKDPEGANVGIPVTWRRRRLRAAEDRLFWRASPLGLYKRELMVQERYQFDEEVCAGVDQLNSTLLWTGGHSISYYPWDPAYVVGGRPGDHVSRVSRSMREHGRIFVKLWNTPEVQALPLKDLRALAHRMLTIHVFSLLSPRSEASMWDPDDFQWLQELALLMEEHAPGMSRRLPLSHRRIYNHLLQGDLQATLAEVNNASYLTNRLPSELGSLLDGEFWIYRKPGEWASRIRHISEKGTK